MWCSQCCVPYEARGHTAYRAASESLDNFANEAHLPAACSFLVETQTLPALRHQAALRPRVDNSLPEEQSNAVKIMFHTE